MPEDGQWIKDFARFEAIRTNFSPLEMRRRKQILFRMSMALEKCDPSRGIVHFCRRSVGKFQL